jgi:hypothetical protein
VLAKYELAYFRAWRKCSRALFPAFAESCDGRSEQTGHGSKAANQRQKQAISAIGRPLVA